jgi:hypothetical protein
MNQTCQNHGFLVNHLARDCHTYKHEIIKADKDKTKGVLAVLIDTFIPPI